MYIHNADFCAKNIKKVSPKFRTLAIPVKQNRVGQCISVLLHTAQLHY